MASTVAGQECELQSTTCWSAGVVFYSLIVESIARSLHGPLLASPFFAACIKFCSACSGVATVGPSGALAPPSASVAPPSANQFIT